MSAMANARRGQPNVVYWATPLLLPVVLLVEHTGSSVTQTMPHHTAPTLSASLFRLVVLAVG